MCVCLILAPCRTRTCVNHGSNTRLLFVALLRSHRRLGNASPLVWCEQGLAPPLLAAELAGVPLGIRVDLGEELVQGSTLGVASTDFLSAVRKSKGGCRSRRARSCWPPAGPSFGLLPWRRPPLWCGEPQLTKRGMLHLCKAMRFAKAGLWAWAANGLHTTTHTHTVER